MKIIKYFLGNGIYGFVVYMGLYHNHDGALNLALFFSWLTIIVSFFLDGDNAIKKLAEIGRSVPAWLNVTFDLCIIAAFVWHGWWVLSVFLMISMILTEAAWIKSKELSK